jgi:hypothetical protein
MTQNADETAPPPSPPPPPPPATEDLRLPTELIRGSEPPPDHRFTIHLREPRTHEARDRGDG